MIPGTWQEQPLTSRDLAPGTRYAVAIMGPGGWTMPDAAKWFGSYLRLDSLNPGASSGPGFTTWEASGETAPPELLNQYAVVPINDDGSAGVTVLAIYQDTSYPPTVADNMAVAKAVDGTFALITGLYYRLVLLVSGTPSSIALQQKLMSMGFGYVEQPFIGVGQSWPASWPVVSLPQPPPSQDYAWVEGPFLGGTLRIGPNTPIPDAPGEPPGGNPASFAPVSVWQVSFAPPPGPPGPQPQPQPQPQPPAPQPQPNVASNQPPPPSSAGNVAMVVLGLGAMAGIGYGLYRLSKMPPRLPAPAYAENPWTPPGASWPLYEVRIKPCRDRYSSMWCVYGRLEKPGEKPHIFRIGGDIATQYPNRSSALQSARTMARDFAKHNARNPNPARVLDEHGRCITAFLGDQEIGCQNPVSTITERIHWHLEGSKYIGEGKSGARYVASVERALAADKINQEVERAYRRGYRPIVSLVGVRAIVNSKSIRLGVWFTFTEALHAADHFDESLPSKNPWTSPGTSWPRYEYKIQYRKSHPQDPNYKHYAILELEMQPGARPIIQHVGSDSVKQDALDVAVNLAIGQALVQPQNPNPVRVIDPTGRCYFAVMASKTSPGNWIEVPCTEPNPLRGQTYDPRLPIYEYRIRRHMPSGGFDLFVLVKRAGERPHIAHLGGRMTRTEILEFARERAQRISIADPQSPVILRDEKGQCFETLLGGEPFWCDEFQQFFAAEHVAAIHSGS